MPHLAVNSPGYVVHDGEPLAGNNGMSVPAPPLRLAGFVHATWTPSLLVDIERKLTPWPGMPKNVLAGGVSLASHDE